MMRKPLLAIALLMLSQVSLGQAAISQDNLLTIPQTAVVDPDNPAYFEDVQLSYDGDGKFTVVAARSSTLVAVDSVMIAILESFPLQLSVSVSGHKSVPCVELQAPVITRKENTFTVMLAETQLGPAESCIAMIDPFETSFAVDILGLSAGSYTVSVNGVEAEFVLAADN